MADDVVVNKVAIIERCLKRVREEYAGDERNISENFTRQDSIILNLQRACEAAIDLAMHLVRVNRLGVPQETREAFDLLHNAGIVDQRIRIPICRVRQTAARKERDDSRSRQVQTDRGQKRRRLGRLHRRTGG